MDLVFFKFLSVIKTIYFIYKYAYNSLPETRQIIIEVLRVQNRNVHYAAHILYSTHNTTRN